MEPTDQDLLAATAAGDGDAFATFWRRHLRIVMGFGIHHCATSEDVADLVADTFLAAFRAAGRYRADTATAAPWLLGVAARVASNQRRTLARRLRVSRRAAGGPPRFTGEEYEAVEAAIDAARQAPHVQAAQLPPAPPTVRQRWRDAGHRGAPRERPRRRSGVLGPDAP
jgi:DNA-directed RNA polymerase specialized sigma24 family protein